MKYTIEELLRKLKQENLDRNEKKRLNESLIDSQREKARQEYLKTNKALYEMSSISNPVASSSAGGKLLSNRIPDVTTDSYDVNFDGTVDVIGIINNSGDNSVTEIGVCYSLIGTPTINDFKTTSVDVGLSPSLPLPSSYPFDYTIRLELGAYVGETVYARSYAINSFGAGYGDVVSFMPDICLVKGTIVSLSNGEYKLIEDINYEDDLLVWNFDKGRFDSSKPLWIKKPQETSQYNLLEFSDGSILKTINQHRIFNKQLGKFTPCMMNTTPIGTITFNSKGEEITLVSKKVVTEIVEYYNIISDRHINIFSNNILTSCRYNNIYPIKNMVFEKENRMIRNQTEFDVPCKYYNGLRLSEQIYSTFDIEMYIKRLISNEIEENIFI